MAKKVAPLKPALIMIIRHAEETNRKGDVHLSSAGYLRAAALYRIFDIDGRFPWPDFLIAADNSKQSHRSVETLETLAIWLHQSVGHEYDSDEYPALVARLREGKKYAGATVLICWHHGTIPELALALGVNKHDLPCQDWPDDDYGSMWILDTSTPGSVKIRSEDQGI